MVNILMTVLGYALGYQDRQANKADRLTRQLGRLALFCACYKRQCFVEEDASQTNMR
jgi:hypothetical protein